MVAATNTRTGKGNLKTLLLIVCLTVWTGFFAVTAVRAATSGAAPSADSAFTSRSGTTTRSSQTVVSVWSTYLNEALRGDLLGKKLVRELSRLYSFGDWRALFIDDRFSLNQAGLELLKRVSTMDRSGLNPQHYPLLELHNDLGQLENLRTETPAILSSRHTKLMYAMNSSPEHAPSPTNTANLEPEQARLYRTAAHVDVLLLTCFVRYVHDMDPFLPLDQAEMLKSVSSMGQFLDSLEPKSAQYALLLDALEHYRELARTTSVTPLTAKESLRLGDHGREVRALQNRLRMEGYFSGEADGYFDGYTEDAVRLFQEQHLLKADGIVGRNTRAWLNVDFTSKARLIADSLAALRHSQTRRFRRYLRINVPEFELEYYIDGQLAARHRIVVGRAGGRKTKIGRRWVGVNHTPSLVSRVKRIVFNPRWYVPERIRLELDKKITENPAYLEEQGFIAMHSYYSNGEPRIYQRPGPDNPLGKVKFEFPNRFSVYLHDTSQKQLFEKMRRDFSHGCVRVAQAVDLARELLEDDRNPAAPSIDGYLESNHQIFVSLKDPVPIIIEYVPVVIDQTGQLLFCGDPYGRLIGDQGRGFPL